VEGSGSGFILVRTWTCAGREREKSRKFLSPNR